MFVQRAYWSRHAIKKHVGQDKLLSRMPEWNELVCRTVSLCVYPNTSFRRESREKYVLFTYNLLQTLWNETRLQYVMYGCPESLGCTVKRVMKSGNNALGWHGEGRVVGKTDVTHPSPSHPRIIVHCHPYRRGGKDGSRNTIRLYKKQLNEKIGDEKITKCFSHRPMESKILCNDCTFYRTVTLYGNERKDR